MGSSACVWLDAWHLGLSRRSGWIEARPICRGRIEGGGGGRSGASASRVYPPRPKNSLKALSDDLSCIIAKK